MPTRAWANGLRPTSRRRIPRSRSWATRAGSRTTRCCSASSSGRLMVGMDAPVVKVVGDKTAKVMASALGLHTVGDLVRHYPRRYAERGVLTPLKDLKVGDHVTVQAEVVHANVRVARTGKQMAEIVVTDGSGRLTLTFFGKAVWRAKDLKAGRHGLFAGTISEFRGTRQLTHPDYQLGGEDDDELLRPLVPIYPASAALPTWNIAKGVRALLQMVEWPQAPLPEPIRRQRGLLGLEQALRLIHRPDTWADVDRAKQRLKWDEAFVLQVTL